MIHGPYNVNLPRYLVRDSTCFLRQQACGIRGSYTKWKCPKYLPNGRYWFYNVPIYAELFRNLLWTVAFNFQLSDNYIFSLKTNEYFLTSPLAALWDSVSSVRPAGSTLCMCGYLY